MAGLSVSARTNIYLDVLSVRTHEPADEITTDNSTMLSKLVVSVWSVFLSVCVFSGSATPCSLEFGVNLENGVTLPNGDILKDGTVFNPENIQEIDGIKVGCICRTKVCIRKCCPSGEYMRNKTCQPTDTAFVIPETVSPFVDSYHFVYGNQCKNNKGRTILDPASINDQKFVLRDNGKLEMIYSQKRQLFKQKDYCVDYIEDLNVTRALVCDYDSDIVTTTQIGTIISMPFLLLTFIVYAILPDRNLYGKSLMCYVMSLFGAYLLLVTVQLYPDNFEVTQCKTLGLLCLFFFMVSFFWMNVMSIDIWWTFSGLRGFSGTRKQTEQKRFLLYSCYAWGVPLLLVAIVTSLTVSPSVPLDVWYNPGIADGQCWFRDPIPSIVFFYGPITILLIINVVLFCITAWNIKKVQKDTAVFKKSNSKKHAYERDKQRFNLYLKLMLAMGVNWSMETISAIVIAFTPIPHTVWYLTDFCNAAYGIFIFFIFVFKKSIWNLLKKRYYMLTGRPHLARSMAPVPSYRTNSSVNPKIAVVHFTNDNNAVKLTSEGA